MPVKIEEKKDSGGGITSSRFKIVESEGDDQRKDLISAIQKRIEKDKKTK